MGRDDQAINFLIGATDTGFSRMRDTVVGGLADMQKAATEAGEDFEVSPADALMSGEEAVKKKGAEGALFSKIKDMHLWRGVTVGTLTAVGGAAAATAVVVGAGVKEWASFTMTMEGFRREMGMDLNEMREFNTAIIGANAAYGSSLSTTGTIARQMSVGAKLAKKDIAELSAELAFMSMVKDIPEETLGEFASKMGTIFSKSKGQITELAFLMIETARAGKMPAEKLFQDFNAIEGALDKIELHFDKAVPQALKFFAAMTRERGSSDIGVGIINKFAQDGSDLLKKLLAEGGDLDAVFADIANAVDGAATAMELEGVASAWNLTAQEVKAVRDAMTYYRPIQDAYIAAQKEFADNGTKSLRENLSIATETQLVWNNIKNAIGDASNFIGQKMAPATKQLLHNFNDIFDAIYQRGDYDPTTPRKSGGGPIGDPTKIDTKDFIKDIFPADPEIGLPKISMDQVFKSANLPADSSTEAIMIQTGQLSNLLQVINDSIRSGQTAPDITYKEFLEYQKRQEDFQRFNKNLHSGGSSQKIRDGIRQD